MGMTDEELIKHLRDTTVFVVSKKDVADHIEQLVMERNTIREAALREALKVIDEWVYCADVEPEILALIGEKE
jgi:hypothetical protein